MKDHTAYLSQIESSANRNLTEAEDAYAAQQSQSETSETRNLRGAEDARLPLNKAKKTKPRNLTLSKGSEDSIPHTPTEAADHRTTDTVWMMSA